jgi:hypothetical protein
MARGGIALITKETIAEKSASFPAEGSKIKITYAREYTGKMAVSEQKVRKGKVWTRRAVVVQKVPMGAGSHVTVEVQPQAQRKKNGDEIPTNGRYRVNFLIKDILMGQVKVEAVE